MDETIDNKLYQMKDNRFMAQEREYQGGDYDKQMMVMIDR